MSAATITSKGQITLPKGVRDRLSLQPGDRVDFVLAADGRYDLIPIKSKLSSLKGCLPAPDSPVTIEAMTNAVRKRMRAVQS